MATIKTDAELYAQVTAGIRVNGNREITPPIHKSIEDNIIASKLSIRDGGNVVESLTGYLTELTLTDRKHFVYKGWLDDAITNLDLSAYFKKDGSVAATGNFNWGGFNISNISQLSKSVGSNSSTIDLNSIEVALTTVDTGINTFFKVNSSGIGIGTNPTFAIAYLKSDNITANRILQLPDGNGTLARLSDIFTITATTLDINGVSQDLSTNREWRTGLADTGVLTYSGASAVSGTQITIGAVTGWIIDNETTPGVPIKTYINYAGESNKTVTTLGSGLATYVLLDSTGTIVFQNTFPTSTQRKTHIYLSKIGHPSGTITTVGNEPDFILSPLAQLRDLSKYIAFVNPDIHPFANGANLNFNINAGTVYRASAYFTTDDTAPNEPPVAAQTPASFLYRTQTGSGGGFVSLIDPTTYDNAGTITAIGGSSNQATNQRIFLVPGLGLIVQPGQTIYSTLTDAIAAVQNESFVIYPSLINNAILIGVLSVTKGCTELNNTTTARFFNADKFGQVGGSTAGVSTATLQSSYNNSLVPQITTTTALGALTLRNGAVSDTTSVVDIKNIAGSTTASINGNGLITGSAFIANGTAGAGYLQLVSQTIPPTAVNGSMILYTDSSTRFSMVRRNNANTSDITRTLIFNDVNVTYTFPSQNTDTIAGLGTAQTFTAQQTFSLSNAIRVGNGSFSSDNSALLINRSLTGTINGHAIRDEGINNSTPNNDGYASFDAQYTTSGTSNYNHQAGFQARHIYSGSGTLADWRGFYSAPNITSGITTNVKNFHVVNPSGAGTITNLYGIYIESLTRGSGSNYAVYTLGTTPSWFSGQIDIGITVAQSGNAATDGHLSLRGLTGSQRFNFGYNTTSNYGWMQAGNFGTSYSPILLNPNGGGVGITIASASVSAQLHIGAGSSTVGVPLKFTAGTNMVTPQTGAVEYNGTNLFFTRTGTTRENIVCASAANVVSPTAPNRTITINIDGTTYYLAAKTTND